MVTIPQIRSVIKGKNRYCGPAAISIIAGVDTTRTAELMRVVSGRRMICGVGFTLMRDTLARLGYEMRSEWVKPNSRFVGWTRSPERNPRLLYLVASGHHYAVVQGDQYCCSQRPVVVSLDQAPHQQSWVQKVFSVFKIADVDLEVVAPAPKVDTEWLARIRVTQNARKHRIEIDDQSRDGGSIWVYPPDDMFKDEEDDPFYDEHFCDTWAEAGQRVDSYARLSTKEPAAEAATPHA